MPFLPSFASISSLDSHTIAGHEISLFRHPDAGKLKKRGNFDAVQSVKNAFLLGFSVQMGFLYH